MTQRHSIPAIAGGQTHELRVRGLAGLVRGPWSATSTGTGGSDTTPPGLPTGLTATGLIRAVALNWVNPTDLDLRSVEVWEAATAGGTYAKIGETGGSHFLRSGMPPGGSAWFRLRAVDRSGNLGAWTAPLQGTASLLLVNDIADGILSTAKFAASISPVGLVTSGAVPTTKAEEVIFHGPTNQLYRWNPTTASYVRLVRTTDLDGQIASAQISNLQADKLIGEVQSAQIANNSIVASKIAAGAVTTGKLAVAPPSGNVIWNSCLPYNRAGWIAGGNYLPTAWGAVGTGLDVADNTWRQPGRGTGGFYRAGVIPADGVCDMYWQGTEGTSTPVLGADWWEFQVRVQAHRCSCEIKIAWHTWDGVWISEAALASTPPTNFPNGASLAYYVPLWGKAQAPPNARFALPFIRMYGQGGWGTATGTDPYVFFTQALFAPSHANQTEPSPWSPGGVTEINGGMLRARSITANEIAASTITATEIAAGAITAGKLAANAVTAGTVAAGAINANELAAGAIRAWHIASETVISQSAQIGNGVITNAKIGNLQVDTLKIADGSINGFYAGWWNGDHQLGTSNTPFISLWAGDGYAGTRNLTVYIRSNWAAGSNFVSSGESSELVTWSTDYVVRILVGGGLIYEAVHSSKVSLAIRNTWSGGGSTNYVVELRATSGYLPRIYEVVLTVQQVKK